MKFLIAVVLSLLFCESVFAEAIIKIPARVNLAPVYFQNSNTFTSVREKYSDSGPGVQIDVEYPIRQAHVMGGFSGIATLSSEEKDQYGSLYILAPYIGYTSDKIDIYAGYALGAMSLYQNETYADPADKIDYTAGVKGGILGFRKYGKSFGPFAVGFGLNLFYLSSSEFKKKSTTGTLVVEEDIKKEASSFGGTFQLILSIGNVSDKK